jgi:hypothetical protein
MITSARHQLAELTYTDEHPPTRANPVAPATGSDHAAGKPARHTDDTATPPHSFGGPLEHLATLARNTITLDQITFDKITTPTPTHRRAFELIGASIPLSLK